MDINKNISSKFIINPLIFNQLSSLLNLKLKSVEVNSDKTRLVLNDVLRVTTKKNNLLLNFTGLNKKGKDEELTYRFHGYPIFDDMQATLDISSFRLSLEQNNDDKNIFVFDVNECIKTIGVYTFVLKNEECDIEIDTCYFIELKTDYHVLFCDVHDWNLDQFYYFRKEEIDKLDIFKTFYYEESRFIDWQKKIMVSFK